MKFITCGTDQEERERVVPKPKAKVGDGSESGGVMTEGAKFGFGTAFGVGLGLFAAGAVVSKLRGA